MRPLLRLVGVRAQHLEEGGCGVLATSAFFAAGRSSHLGEEAGTTHAFPSTLVVAIVYIMDYAVTVKGNFIIFRLFSKGPLGCGVSAVPGGGESRLQPLLLHHRPHPAQDYLRRGRHHYLQGPVR